MLGERGTGCWYRLPSPHSLSQCASVIHWERYASAPELSLRSPTANTNATMTCKRKIAQKKSSNARRARAFRWRQQDEAEIQQRNVSPAPSGSDSPPPPQASTSSPPTQNKLHSDRISCQSKHYNRQDTKKKRKYFMSRFLENVIFSLQKLS